MSSFAVDVRRVSTKGVAVVAVSVTKSIVDGTQICGNSVVVDAAGIGFRDARTCRSDLFVRQKCTMTWI